MSIVLLRRVTPVERELFELDGDPLKTTESRLIYFVQDRRVSVSLAVAFQHDSRPFIERVGHDAKRPCERLGVRARMVEVRQMRARRIDKRIPSDVCAVPNIAGRVKVEAEAWDLRLRVPFKRINRCHVFGQAHLEYPLGPSGVHLGHNLLQPESEPREPRVHILHGRNRSSGDRP